MAKTYYAWSTIYLGGETKVVKDRKLIVKRNIVEPGTEVTKVKLKISDDEWDAMVKGGSVRPYKYPDIPNTFGGSPSEYVMSRLRKGEEDIDSDTILSLALSIHEPDDEAETADSELAQANSGS